MTGLIIAGLVFIILSGVIHIGIFLLESVLWRPRRTWRSFEVRSEEDAEIARPWALNQGFYNLFLAIGAIAGAGIGIVGRSSSTSLSWTVYLPFANDVMTPALVLNGWAWVAVFSALCMVGAAAVLIASSRGRLLRGAIVQGAAPLVGVLLIGIGLLAGA